MRFWLSWVKNPEHGPFELHQPWWISGYTNDGHPTICAGIIADNEIAAKELVRKCYDNPPPAEAIYWRFLKEMPEHWDPFCGRFPRAKWMVWP